MSGNNVERMLSEEEKTIFRKALKALNAARVPYVVGGAFAVSHYSGIWRNTKDLDILVTPRRRDEVMSILGRLGFQTWIEFEPWLAKATMDQYLIDIVYGMGNWIAPVDEVWIEKANPGVFLKVPVLFAPPEEMIWHKAFIAARDRFDGGDINHIIRATKGNLDWMRIADRFQDHWEVLLSTLIVFRYVYPSHRDYVPLWLLRELIARLQENLTQERIESRLCRGTLFDSIGTYLMDIEQLGYRDAREVVYQPRLAHAPNRRVQTRAAS